MDQLTVLPFLPGEPKDGWLPAAQGNTEYINKMDHVMRAMGMRTGFRRLGEDQFFMWMKRDEDVVLPIEEFRKAIMRAPLGNEEGGYLAYEEESHVES